MGLPLSTGVDLGGGGPSPAHPHHVPLVRFNRRGVLAGAGAAMAAATLLGPGAVMADDEGHDSSPLPQPKPIPGGLAPGFHVWAPGPTNITLPFSQLTLQGLDVDPADITDYSGFTALVYPVGTAHASDGKKYNLEGDMRVYSGSYVPMGSTTARQGTFGFV